MIRWGTKDGKQLWRCKDCGKYLYYGEKRQKENKPLKYDFSLGYVIGVLKGDGSLTITKDYHYFNENNKQVPKKQATKIVPRKRHTIELTCKDGDFAEAFKQELQKETGKKPTLYHVVSKALHATLPRQKDGHVFRGYRVCLTSIEWYNKLLPLTQDMEWLKNSDLEVKRGFLVGLFDSEGTVDSRPRVHLSNKVEQLLILAQFLLRNFGIMSFIYRFNNGMYRLSIHSKKDMREFVRCIGFSINRKNEKIKKNGNI